MIFSAEADINFSFFTVVLPIDVDASYLILADMDLPAYPIISKNGLDEYHFLSEGPHGTILKIVKYQRVNRYLFNIHFGDWDEDGQCINDKARTNNLDRDKILATVANTVIDFIDMNPDAVVFAIGSSAARTRLYQIGIAMNLPIISQRLHVEGFFKGRWEPFRKTVNYSAFMVTAQKELPLE